MLSTGVVIAQLSSHCTVVSQWVPCAQYCGRRVGVWTTSLLTWANPLELTPSSGGYGKESRKARRSVGHDYETSNTLVGALRAVAQGMVRPR
jgi:hypothetical protein